MQIQFKQAVSLKGKNGKSKDYSRGIHEVDSEHLEDPHFHRLLKAGLVLDVEETRVIAPTSLQDKQKRLAEKLAKASKTAVPSASKKPDPAPSGGEEGSSHAALSSPPVVDDPEQKDPPPELSEEEELAKMEAEEDAAEKAKAAEKASKKQKNR